MTKELKINELRKLAKDNNIPTKVGITKEELQKILSDRGLLNSETPLETKITSKTKETIKKEEMIFNELYLDFSKPLVLVEGLMDAIKARENAVPILGTELREESRLFQKILKHKTPVYIVLDSDAVKKEEKIL